MSKTQVRIVFKISNVCNEKGEILEASVSERIPDIDNATNNCNMAIKKNPVRANKVVTSNENVSQIQERSENTELQDSLSKRLIEHVLTLKTFSFGDLVQFMGKDKTYLVHVVIAKLLGNGVIKRTEKKLFVLDEEASKNVRFAFKNRNVTTSLEKFMHSRKTFEVAEIVQHFPNLSRSSINSVLQRMMKKGTIRRVSRGKYEVIKESTDVS